MMLRLEWHWHWRKNPCRRRWTKRKHPFLPATAQFHKTNDIESIMALREKGREEYFEWNFQESSNPLQSFREGDPSNGLSTWYTSCGSMEIGMNMSVRCILGRQLFWEAPTLRRAEKMAKLKLKIVFRRSAIGKGKWKVLLGESFSELYLVLGRKGLILENCQIFCFPKRDGNTGKQ